MNPQLHPIFKNLLKQYFGATPPPINAPATESSQRGTNSAVETMNLNPLMSAVEARDDVWLAEQAARNAAWEAAYEEAEEKICFDDWLDVLFRLSEPDKAAALGDIANGRFPGSLAKAYDQLIAAQAEAILQPRGEQDGPAGFED